MGTTATKAIIIGAGVGGLTTAIALRRMGMDVVIFERASDLRKIQVGAGLMLWTNALRALQHLGLADQVIAIGSQIETFEIRTWKHDLISRWPVGDWARAQGMPTVCVRRADLHQTLATAASDQMLRFGATCTGFKQDAQGVTVCFADGQEVRGDLLIGADGISSAIRAQLHGSHKPSYAGYTAWRAVASPPYQLIPPGVTRVVWGCGARFIYYQVGQGRSYWLALAKSPPRGHDVEGQRKAAVLARYKGWANPVEALLEATDESAILRTDITDRRPIKAWGAGRVTLLGDAAHPMTPNQAQGACQAIEDAVVLAKCLSREPQVAPALRMYEAQRMDRTAKFQRQSRSIGALANFESPLVCWGRNQMLKIMMNTVARRQNEQDMSYAF